MNGTEQTLFENTEIGEYNGYVYLDALQTGDTIRLRVYIKDPENELYKLRDSKDFTGVQANPAVGFLATMASIGYKVTAHQIAGTYRVLTHNWFKR